MTTAVEPRPLTNAQALLLQLFDQDLPDADLTELRQLLIKHLHKKMDQEVTRIQTETGQTAADIEREVAAINENRTAYKTRLRADRI